MTIRILAAGDVHIGRVPTGLPADLQRDATQYGPLAALDRIVDLAIRDHADAVLFAGDLVDDTEDVLEAYAKLRESLLRLAEAGIPTLAVAGNHDVKVLPQLAAHLDGQLQVIGAGGEWETKEIEGRDGTKALVAGWSFPLEWARGSPLSGFPHLDPGGRAVLGLLHCDVGGQGRYAAVARSELEASPVDAWLLGHVHKPDPLADQHRPMGYLGAVTALDPSDLGARGPWWIEVDGPGSARARQVPLAPLRFEAWPVDVSGRPFHDEDDLVSWLTRAVDEAARRFGEAAQVDVAVGLRVRLEGIHEARRAIELAVKRVGAWDGTTREGCAQVFIERVDIRVLPWADLEDLALDGGPLGLLARKILLLQGHGEAEERSKLISRVRQHLEHEGLDLRGEEELQGEEELVTALAEAATRALAALIAQRESGE
ncbi:MAG: exonuclease SbcCD subunit D [Anaerolineae bacterium]